MTQPTPPTPLQIGYTDPDGNFWDLSDTSLESGYICTGIAGNEGLPVAMQSIPMLDGTARSDLYMAQPGTISIGIYVSRPASDNENDYYNLLDRIVRAFYNRRNALPAPGSISIQRPDGTSRQISTFTTSGLNTPEVGVSNGTIYAFTLATPDPFWYDVDDNSIYFSNPGAAAGILPLLPIILGSSTVFGASTVYNYGGADTYPEWLITGPGAPVMSNLTTGRAWALSPSIPSGNIVSVKTKPGYQQAVNITTGVNIWDQLVISSPRDLWPLIPGPNYINVSMSGSTSASLVTLIWRSRWLRSLWQSLP